MANRSIILHRVGNFYGTFPASFYFYLKIIGDIEHRNVKQNLGLLLAKILVHNYKYLNSIFDSHIQWRVNVPKDDRLFQNFRKWVEK